MEDHYAHRSISSTALASSTPADTTAQRRCRGRYPRAARVSPDYPKHPSDVPCPLPRWIRMGARIGCFPIPRGLPRYSGGSASTTSLSGPAQASLALRPTRSQPAQGGLLSRGFDPVSYPTEPLGSYHVLPTTTWVDPPSTGDLRRWGALLTTGWALSFGDPDRHEAAHLGVPLGGQTDRFRE